MASYQTQRDRIKDYFMTKVFPIMTIEGIDFNKTVSLIASEVGSSSSMVEDFFKDLVASGKIIETRVLDLTPQEIEDRKVKKLEQIKLELKEAGL